MMSRLSTLALCLAYCILVWVLAFWITMEAHSWACHNDKIALWCHIEDRG